MSNRVRIDAKHCVKPIAMGVVVAVVSSIVLLILFSVFMLIQNLPRNSGYFLSFIIISLSTLFGGFACARLARQNGLILGSVVGALYILVVSLIGAAAGFALNLFGTFLIKALFSVGFGALGGILAMNIRRK